MGQRGGTAAPFPYPKYTSMVEADRLQSSGLSAIGESVETLKLNNKGTDRLVSGNEGWSMSDML